MIITKGIEISGNKCLSQRNTVLVSLLDLRGAYSLQIKTALDLRHALIRCAQPIVSHLDLTQCQLRQTEGIEGFGQHAMHNDLRRRLFT